MSIWYAMWGSDGRISRTTFWLSTLVLWGAGLAVWLLVLGPIDPKSIPFDDLVRMAEWAGLITSIVLLYPWVMVAIKRLHDLGATGWWSVPLFVPGIRLGLSIAGRSARDGGAGSHDRELRGDAGVFRHARVHPRYQGTKLLRA